jgi:hypothetical protein
VALAVIAAIALAACDAKAPTTSGSMPAASAAPDTTAATSPTPQIGTPVPAVAAPAARPVPVQPANTAPNYQGAGPIYTGYQAPISQPVPIAAPWAPPPMLVESIPAQPSPDANWTGGYWVWRNGWEWAPGYWATPPRPRYHWVPPYYEHRQDRVVFVDGFWAPPGTAFVPPPRNLAIVLAVVGAGIAIGMRPEGPEGPFVPAPPGSRAGLIVPAPIGTAPAVVSHAPAIISPGMRVTANVNRVTNNINNTSINNRNSTVVNNITNVTIEAPAATTANHQAVRVTVPAQAHLAAAAAPDVTTQMPGRNDAPARPVAPSVPPVAATVPHPNPVPAAPPPRANGVQPAPTQAPATEQGPMKRALPVRPTESGAGARPESRGSAAQPARVERPDAGPVAPAPSANSQRPPVRPQGEQIRPPASRAPAPAPAQVAPPSAQHPVGVKPDPKPLPIKPAQHVPPANSPVGAEKGKPADSAHKPRDEKEDAKRKE